MGSKHWENKKLLITSNYSVSYSVFKGLVLQTPIKQGLIWDTVKIYTDLCANNNSGIVEVDCYFYAPNTQKGNDGIVLFENYGLNWAMKLIKVQNAHLTKADMYP